MFLYSKLKDYNKEIRVSIIGCGKFASMFVAQLNFIKGITLDSVVDIDIKKAKNIIKKTGLEKNKYENIYFYNDIDNILERNIDVVIEATGDPISGVLNSIKIINNKINIVMVNVEADVIGGKYLSDLAIKNNVLYSMSYGDQPALIVEMVEWAKLNGFKLICAGKGTLYHSSFEYSTPDDVWKHYGVSADEAKSANLNSKMFNSFLTGDKSSIEMAAVSNATNLKLPKNGLTYPALSIDQLPSKLISKQQGGLLDQNEQVEVVSCIDKKKNKIKNNLRWGIFIVIKGQSRYIKDCFKQYGIITDKSGAFSALWRPFHYVGLELAQSIFSIVLDRKPTGTTLHYNAEVVAVAKKSLNPGEILDGEGGYRCRGKLISSKNVKKYNYLPLGLSNGAVLTKKVLKDSIIKLSDIELKLPIQIKKVRNYQFKLLS